MGIESKQPGYEPSAEEIARAEDMMTPEQQQASAERAESHIQEQPPWEDFESDKIDENYERRPPTEAEKAEMDQRLGRLGQLMGETDARWLLDGATNISLYDEGEYIGVHKDVDISVEPEDLARFEADMAKQGYGLFESLPRPHQDSPRQLKRLAADQVDRVGHGENLVLQRIDEKGKLVKDEELDAIDLHLIRRDEEGRALGKKGTPLPDHWLEARPAVLEDGQEVNASQPARTLYYKLHQGREYDFRDLEKLADTGALREQDISEVREVVSQEAAADRALVERAVAPVVEQLAAATDADSALAALRQSPVFAERMTSENEDRFRRLAERLASAEKRTPEGLVRAVSDFSGLGKDSARQMEALDRLSVRLSERQGMEVAREALEALGQEGEPPDKENEPSGKENEPLRIEGFAAGLEKLTGRAAELLAGKDSVLVAVSGKSGSGKSEMARQMRERLAEQGTEAVIVSSDDFYEGGSAERPQDKRLNLEKLQRTIERLRSGESVGQYEAAPVVLVEGLQAIDNEVVGQTPDLRAHVETDFGQRMGRRLVRDARVGYRDVGSSLDTIAKLAVDNPDVFRQFEASPDLSHVDMVVENDYQEPDEPSIAVQGDQLVFSVGGQVQESRRLSPEERKAVLGLGFEESK